MKFRFRLEKMLHFEEMKEATKKAAVAKSTDNLLNLRRHLSRLEISVAIILGKSVQDSFRGSEWFPYQSKQIENVLREKQLLNAQIKVNEDELEVLRKELAKVSMRKKALAELKEKKFGDFKIQTNRREQKIVDELFQLTSRKEQD